MDGQVGRVEFFAAIALGRISPTGATFQSTLKQREKWCSIAPVLEFGECDEPRKAKAYGEEQRTKGVTPPFHGG